MDELLKRLFGISTAQAAEGPQAFPIVDQPVSVMDIPRISEYEADMRIAPPVEAQAQAPQSGMRFPSMPNFQMPNMPSLPMPNVPEYMSGLISDPAAAQQQAQRSGLLNAAIALLEAGGPQQQRTTLGQAVGSGLGAYQKGVQGTFDQMLQGMLLKSKLTPKAETTDDIKEYNFAVSQGYKGSFEKFQTDMRKAGATSITLPSEGERKAGFLTNRIKFGLQQMQSVLKENAPAASPEALPSVVKYLTGSNVLSNTLTSRDRQRIEAAQREILDPALTLGTGAAYTAEQIENYRLSYFPQIGDSEETIRDKQARLTNLLESAYIVSGRAAPTGEMPSFAPPQSGQPATLAEQARKELERRQGAR